MSILSKPWRKREPESKPPGSVLAAASQRASGHRFSWNPLDQLDFVTRYRNSPPSELLGYVQKPPALLRFQSNWRQAEYYQRVGELLRSLRPEDVGLERLLDARITAARGSTLSGNAAELREIRNLVAGSQALENGERPEEGWKTRQRARRYLARRLEPLAEQACQRGDTEAALEVLRGLEDTGALSPRLLRTYGRLLWTSYATSDFSSLRVYMQCLEQQGWQTGGDSLLESFQHRLSEGLRIREDTPRPEIATRMALITRMRAGGGNLNNPAKNLGLGYLLLDQPERALPHLERASEVDGQDNGETLFFLAQSFYGTDQHEKAAAAFDKAVGMGYPQSRIAAWQGLALAKSGRWAAAYEVFRIAEQTLSPETDAAFFVYWARASYCVGDVDQARTRFQQAIDRSRQRGSKIPGPAFDWLRAQYGLAVCLVHEGKADEASILLQDVLSVTEKFAPAAHLLGWLFERNGLRNDAVRYYRAAVKANPGDGVYLLSLGLILDDEGNPQALPLLSKALDAGRGGLEVMRRLALACHRTGAKGSARAWFGRIIEELPSNAECLRWVTRYTATEATELFNRGAFAEAIGLWEKVLAALPDKAVSECLGRALLCDASQRLRSQWSGDLESVWAQIARAHALAPCRESRYLNALVLLARGEYRTSHGEFAALDDGSQECAPTRFLALLARYLGGEEAAASEFTQLEPLAGLQGLNALVGLLQIQAAALAGDFPLAAQRLEAWAGLPGVQVAGGSRSDVNALVWVCVKHSGWRHAKLARFREELKGSHESFWQPALAVLYAQQACKAKAGEAIASELENCEQLFQVALVSLSVAERGLLLREYAAFLRYRIEDAVCRGDLALAASLLERLEKTSGPGASGIARLRTALELRLREPSQERAYALIDRDPEAARATWKQRLELHQGEHASLEHLACLAWTRAYDAVRAGDDGRALAEQKEDKGERKALTDRAVRNYDAALVYFAEGLGYFRELYADESYWEALRAKGRKLVSANNPFDEVEFNSWRSSALQEKGQVLVDLAVHLAHQDKKAGQARAKSVMAKIRSCGLPKTTVEALAEKFALQFLDRDPTEVTREQFEIAMARAERVLQMDPDNLPALTFVVRGHTYRAENRGSEEPDVVADRLASVRPRAEHLERQMAEMDVALRTRAKRDLAAYWENLGFFANRKTNGLVGAANKSGDLSAQIMRAIRAGTDESEQAFDRAVKLDSTIALKIKEYRDHNKGWDTQLRERGY